MYNTQGFIGRRVLCLENSSIIGEVKSVLFCADGKQAFYLALSRDSGATLLPFDKIESAKDAIVINSEAMLSYDYDVDMTALCTLDGKEIYSQTGEQKGTVENVELFANGKTSKILAGDTGYSPSAFQTFGGVLLLKAAKKRVSKPRIPRDKTDRKVEILAGAPTGEQMQAEEQPQFNSSTSDVGTATSELQVEKDDNLKQSHLANFQIEPAEVKPPAFIEQGSPLFSQDALEKIVGKEVVFEDGDEKTPARIITDYDFLLGRTLLRDLFTYANTLIARAGTIVSKELVETSARHGKLVELTLNSSYK